MKRLLGFIAIISMTIFLFSCSEPSTARKKMKAMENSMDSGSFPLKLDRSGLEDVVNYMGRSADSMQRGLGDKRELVYEFHDGSKLIFVMKPNPAGGLLLDFFKAEN